MSEYETFIARFPEFDGVPRGAAEAQLADARLLLSRPVWGRYYERARMVWTAHHLALRFGIEGRCAELGIRSPYEAGAVTSMTASTSSLAVTTTPSGLQTSADPVTAGFSRTLYGLEYLGLLETAIPAGFAVLSPDTSETLS